MVLSKCISNNLYMALDINNANYELAQYRIPTNDRTPPINPNNFTNIAGAEYLGQQITIVDSTIEYKVEDSIDKRGNTPFSSVHSVEFLNLESDIDSAKNNPIPSDIIMVDYIITVENNGCTASTSYLQTVSNIPPSGTINFNASFITNWINSLQSSNLNLANIIFPVGNTPINTSSINWDTKRITINAQNINPNISLNLVGLEIIVNRNGNIVQYDAYNQRLSKFMFSIDLINAIHNPLLTTLAELHPQQVFYKTLKIKCYGTNFREETGIPLTNCTETCQNKFLITYPIQGTIDTQYVNTSKSLGYQAIFPGISAVTRRIISFVTFENTSNAKNSQAARNLATLLSNVRSVNNGFSFIIRPVFLRDNYYRFPIFVYLEGLRNTASKKRQFISEEIVVKNNNNTQNNNQNNSQ